MNHEPMCNTNIRCAVLHENGICPDKRKCDCKLSRPTPTPPTEKCCETCRFAGWTERNDFCKVSNCPCHTTDTGWEERFDNEFSIEFSTTTRKWLKTFIQALAKEEYERGRKDLATEIRIAMEVTKAQGYEDFSNRVLQLVDGLEALETPS